MNHRFGLALMLTILCFFVQFSAISVQAEENKIAAYLLVGKRREPIAEVLNKIETSLKDNGFEVFGKYSPIDPGSQQIIIFSRKDLLQKCSELNNRGILAAFLKIGLLKQENGDIEISILNPEYLGAAYLRKEYGKLKSDFEKISKDLKIVFQAFGLDFANFGGSMTQKKLEDYYYMWPAATQTFDDPITLATYDSFDEGVITIEKNLGQRVEDTDKVFSWISEDKKIAVFGIALHSKSTGESIFLPKIGIQNLAAMPYEVILVDKQATMLHAKFRLAVHWPELTMGQFMKISSTPGNIESSLKAVAKQK